MNRRQRVELADETLRILRTKKYQLSTGETVDISSALENCIQLSDCYEPGQLAEMRDSLIAASSSNQTVFAVANETTLSGAWRLTEKNEFANVGVLNFASAKSPGGGFRTGSQAQEESLARSSGLFYSLLEFDGYYDYHKGLRTCMYSDRMIFSPKCPVFRDDDGHLLQSPYAVSILTSPAPNAGAIAKNEPQKADQIENVFRERMSKALALFAAKQCDALVLGAWGCGVFRNDSNMVAKLFGELLNAPGCFADRFKYVLFSVLDSSPQEGTYSAFRETFTGRAGASDEQE